MEQRRDQLSEYLRNILMNIDNLPSDLTLGGQRYTFQEPISSGQKGVVWKVKDNYSRERAVKLAIYEDYENRSFEQELTLAAKLDPYREFANFITAGLVELNLLEHGSKRFICFIEEWVDGYTLKEFLVRHKDDITCSFLKAYVDGMCVALNALKTVGIRHDDLHDKNVMLARPVPGSLSDRWSIKIVDTGSLKPISIPSKKDKDDHKQFVHHLVAIHNVIVKKRTLHLQERLFLKECRKLFSSLLDDDPSVALISPEQIKSQFDFAYSRSQSPRIALTSTMRSPFEYISAEHIADDKLLVNIFAKSCPWLDKVAGPDPCLVTGPRGCGKSTIFRWLSLKTHLHKEVLDLEQFQIAGFYISCTSDLQNRLGWIKTEALAEKFRKEIIHYFNLLLTREIIYTLCIIENRNDKETYWGLSEIQGQILHSFLKEALQSTHQVIKGVSHLKQSLELLEIEMFRCHIQMLKGLNLNWTTPETHLGDLTSLLTQHFEFFRKYRITFLLDDFSIHRLPALVQTILNRVIWERRATHIFKLSSEKHGAVLTDSSSATADLTREMLEIDCGREFIVIEELEPEKAENFAIELLENRLKSAQYSGSPIGLLGHSHWDEGSLARALREKKKGRMNNNQYHGIECIAKLCSGDISTLLFVYRRIFEEGGIRKDSVSLIQKYIQHKAIETVSRDLFEAIKHHYPYGPKMYEIAHEFGTLVGNILRQGRMLKSGPAQCPRIEVDQDLDALREGLVADQEQLAKELVRRAIFIEMEPGRSRHGNVTTLRWHFRKIYLPTFSAALSKNDAIKWKPSDFKFFLIDPSEICAREWRNRQKEKVKENFSLNFDEPTE